MATILNKPKQDDNQEQSPGITRPGGSTGATAASSARQQAPASSGRFTNIQQFLGANKGAGQQIGQAVTKQKDDVVRKVGTGVTAGERAVQGISDEAEAFREGANVAQNIKEGNTNQYFSSAPAPVQPQQAAAPQSAPRPPSQFTTGFTSSQDQILNSGINKNSANQLVTGTAPQYGDVTDQFKRLATGDINEDVLSEATSKVGSVQSLLNELKNYGTNLGTEQGRQQLIRDIYNKQGNYGQGVSALDQVFLQKSGSPLLAAAQRDVNQNVGQTGRTFDNLNTRQTEYTDLVNKLAGESASAIGGALSQGISEFDAAQLQQAQELNQKRAQEQNLFQQFLSTGYQGMDDTQRGVVNSILSQGGLSAGQRTYGLDLQGGGFDPYRTLGRTDLTSRDVVDANELARITALGRLAGVTTNIDPTLAQQYTTSSNEADMSGLNVDYGRLLSDIESSRQGQNLFQARDLSAPNGSGFSYRFNPFSKSNYTAADLETIERALSTYGGRDKVFGGGRDDQARLAFTRELINAGLLNPQSIDSRGVNDPGDTGISMLIDALSNLQGVNYLGGRQ